jgi:hypothetical protein
MLRAALREHEPLPPLAQRPKLSDMHKFLTSVFLTACLFAAIAMPIGAQEKKPNAPTPRDDSSMTLPFVMAGIGILVVMVLVCMPARRE